jgi:septal ring factor EnvC (AmiA/AmiB activator)
MTGFTKQKKKTGSTLVALLGGALIMMGTTEVSAQTNSQLQSQINSLNSRVASAESRLSSVTSRVSIAESKITTIDQKATALNARVANLESDARRCSDPNNFQLMYDTNGGVLQIDGCGRVARTIRAKFKCGNLQHHSINIRSNANSATILRRW